MISSKEMRTWQAGLTAFDRPMRISEAASLLGRTPETLSRLRRNGVPDGEEKIMRLAMAALSSGLKPWGIQ